MIALIRFAPWIGGALMVAGVIGWHFFETSRAYDKGFSAALATVEQMDGEAKEAAQDARKAVNICYDKGGTWDAISASCRM